MFSLIVSYGTNGDQKSALLYKELAGAQKAREELLAAYGAKGNKFPVLHDDFGHEFSPYDTQIHAISIEDSEKALEAYVHSMLVQARVQVRASTRARSDPELSRSPIVNPTMGGLPMGSPFIGRG
jgi:hypothetical protein